MSLAEKHFHTLSQVGFVVRDLDKLVQAMREKLGVEPVYGTTPDAGREYRGESGDFVARMAFYRFSNVELEFIQPISGKKSIWQDFLDSGREGIHHIRFSIEEGAQKDVVEAMDAAGFPIYQKGLSVRRPGCVWTYYDTEPDLTFVIETQNDLDPSD